MKIVQEGGYPGCSLVEQFFADQENQQDGDGSHQKLEEPNGGKISPEDQINESDEVFVQWGKNINGCRCHPVPVRKTQCACVVMLRVGVFGNIVEKGIVLKLKKIEGAGSNRNQEDCQPMPLTKSGVPFTHI